MHDGQAGTGLQSIDDLIKANRAGLRAAAAYAAHREEIVQYGMSALSCIHGVQVVRWVLPTHLPYVGGAEQGRTPSQWHPME